MFLPRPSYNRSRRTATVMQSAPESASDSCIASNVSYLPVPTINRLCRVCDPIRKDRSVRASVEDSAIDMPTFYMDNALNVGCILGPESPPEAKSGSERLTAAHEGDDFEA